MFLSQLAAIVLSLPGCVQSVLVCLNCLLFVFFLLFLLPCLNTQDVSPEDVDLENEPWYKFFSEMEFDKAVSGSPSCDTPLISVHVITCVFNA